MAKEIAERTGNLALVRIVLNSYIKVADSYNICPIAPEEYSKVSEALRELEPIALETNRRGRKASINLDKFLDDLPRLLAGRS